LAERYAKRSATYAELSTYDQVRADLTEAAVPDLAVHADLVIDTDRTVPSGVLMRSAARLGLLPHVGEQLVDVVVGGQFGSEGKGNICFYLAPEYDLLLRVGGPNAGHKVPTDPVYTHRLLPSGTLANTGAQLMIGPGAVISVDILLAEISDCRVDADRLFIDPQAAIIEDDDVAAEVEHLGSISSTRQGVGRATARRINARGTYPDGMRLAKDVPELRPYTHRSTHELLEEYFLRGKRVLLEGTQGSGLSIFHGQYPHVTSRDTSAAGCLAEAGVNPRRVRRVVVVARTRPIRVGGTSGPMAEELTLEDVARAAGLPSEDLLEREIGSVTGTVRRIADFDWEQLRRAVELNGATDIALTFADYLDHQNRGAHRFDQLTRETIGFIDDVEHVAGCRVSLVSTDFHRRAVLDRREWRGNVPDPPSS
jgi:adenylosuccinate synthase